MSSSKALVAAFSLLLTAASGLAPTSHGTAGWFAPERAHPVDASEAGFVSVLVPPYSIVQMARSLDGPE